MAEIKPFRAFRYGKNAGDVSNNITPHYEGISFRELLSIYKNPSHSIHLIHPQSGENLREKIKEWKDENILMQDPLPGIYVYYQYYQIPDDSKIYCRKGFICNVKIHDWKEKIILPHEQTIKHALDNRLEILKRTKMNITPVHGLYTDTEEILEKFMDESIQAPIYEIKDMHGVINKLSLIHDASVIKIFLEVLREKQIILADGHHRYNASLQYKNNNKGNPAAGFINMYLSNTENNEIKIAATHRLIQQKDFVLETLLKKISGFFHVRTLSNPGQLMDEINKKPFSMALLTASESFILELKPDFQLKNNNQSEIGMMQEIIVDKILAESVDSIQYSSNKNYCVSQLEQEKANFVLLGQDISLEEIKKVCYQGFTYPAKTTYFYPKVLSGLVFNSISEDDYIKNAPSCFKY